MYRRVMPSASLNDLLIVTSPGKGRGVISQRHFSAGDLIERCPIIILGLEDVLKTVLRFYTFEWDSSHEAVVLGYGMLYNHSLNPNVQYVKCIQENVVDFLALENICAGSELLINYNGQPSNKAPIEFVDGGWSKSCS